MTRLLAPVLAVGLLAAGCDITGSTKQTPAPKPLSHAQFVRRANRACTRAIRRIPKFHRGMRLQQVERKLNALVRVQERLLFVLRGLTPPRRDAAAFRSMIGTFDREDLAANRFLDAVEGLQIRRLRALSRRLQALGKRIDFFAGLIGLRTCAKAE